ncbi:hypothetical protein ISTM_309 [Insectomime virus]|nr:hypothetical protein ISTM_309 [Insectomime virus]
MLKTLCVSKVSDTSCLPSELQEYVQICKKRPVTIPSLATLASCAYLEEETGKVHLDDDSFWWMCRVLGEKNYKALNALERVCEWELSETVVTASVCLGKYKEEPLPEDLSELGEYNERNCAAKRTVTQKRLLCNLLDEEELRNPQVQIFLR